MIPTCLDKHRSTVLPSVWLKMEIVAFMCVCVLMFVWTKKNGRDLVFDFLSWLILMLCSQSLNNNIIGHLPYDGFHAFPCLSVSLSCAHHDIPYALENSNKCLNEFSFWWYASNRETHTNTYTRTERQSDRLEKRFTHA